MTNSNLPEIPESGKKAVAIVGATTSTGAIIGSLIPGVGTAIGAGVGGIIGGAAVIISEVSKINQD